MCAKALYIGKAKIKLRHKLNNYKSKHRTFKKRNQKVFPETFSETLLPCWSHSNWRLWFSSFKRCEMYKHLKERDMF